MFHRHLNYIQLTCAFDSMRPHTPLTSTATVEEEQLKSGYYDFYHPCGSRINIRRTEWCAILGGGAVEERCVPNSHAANLFERGNKLHVRYTNKKETKKRGGKMYSKRPKKMGLPTRGGSRRLRCGPCGADRRRRRKKPKRPSEVSWDR